MDRRTFAKLSAMTAVASALPSAATAQADAPVGYAAVGLGDISTIFLRALQSSKNSRVAGLVTGHPEDKGAKFAAQYDVPQSAIYTYANYGRIRDNKAIDAVYIGLPNSMHCEYTVRAAEAGKHVLCEKPMAVSAAECRRMIDACRAHNVKLMIAYRVHYDPTWQQIRELVQRGELGELKGFQGGFYGNKRAGEWRLDRKLSGGGSLMDLGIYPLNAIRWIHAAAHPAQEPASYSAQVTTIDRSGKFALVEEAVDFTMKFPSGVLAMAGSSYGEQGGAYLRIDGSEGTLLVEPAFYYDGLKYSGKGRSGALSGGTSEHAPYQFTYEADHFSHCIRSGTQPDTAGEEGLADMLAMEAIYKAAGAPIA